MSTFRFSTLVVLASIVTQSLAGSFLVRNANVPYYPYTVHLPDRATRNLANLTSPPPAILFLSGSGARGPAINASRLSGFDGVGKRIRLYNAGAQNVTENQLAAEEFLTIIPIAPDDVPQDDGPKWNLDPIPGILTSVYAEFPFDLKRLYVSGYSMGARGGFWLMVQDPKLFAAGAFAAGSTSATAQQLTPLKNIPIRQYVGSDDEKGPVQESENTQSIMDSIGANTQTIIVQGADHISMGDVPFDADMLSWLLQQSSPTNAQLPAPNTTTTFSSVPNGVPSNIAPVAAHSGASRTLDTRPFLASMLAIVGVAAISTTL